MIDASEGGLPYLQLEPREACAETALYVPKQWKSFNFLAGSIRAWLFGVKGIGKRFVNIFERIARVCSTEF